MLPDDVLPRNIYILSTQTLRGSIFLQVSVARTDPYMSAMATNNLFVASPRHLDMKILTLGMLVRKNLDRLDNFSYRRRLPRILEAY